MNSTGVEVIGYWITMSSSLGTNSVPFYFEVFVTLPIKPYQ